MGPLNYDIKHFCGRQGAHLVPGVRGHGRGALPLRRHVLLLLQGVLQTRRQHVQGEPGAADLRHRLDFQ